MARKASRAPHATDESGSLPPKPATIARVPPPQKPAPERPIHARRPAILAAVGLLASLVSICSAAAAAARPLCYRRTARRPPPGLTDWTDWQPPGPTCFARSRRRPPRRPCCASQAKGPPREPRPRRRRAPRWRPGKWTVSLLRASSLKAAARGCGGRSGTAYLWTRFLCSTSSMSPHPPGLYAADAFCARPILDVRTWCGLGLTLCLSHVLLFLVLVDVAKSSSPRNHDGDVHAGRHVPARRQQGPCRHDWSRRPTVDEGWQGHHPLGDARACKS